MIDLVPVELDEANDYVRRFHRHSRRTPGWKFGVGIAERDELRGVAIAGRPVARGLDNGYTVEILRVCTDGVPNGCTRLYGACCRAAAALGYRLAVTYTLDTELGASLRAAGFHRVADVDERQWSCDARPRLERDLVGGKIRWARRLSKTESA